MAPTTATRPVDGIAGRPRTLILALRTLGLALLLGIIPFLYLTRPTLGQGILWFGVFGLLPAAILMAGYATWREVCPLSLVSRLPRALHVPGPFRLGPWWQNNSVLVQFVLFVTLIALRFAWFEGTVTGTLFLLGVLVGAALASGFLFTGKTWCNHFCPLGFVERVYAGPRPLRPSHSKCSNCSACKRHCPDIGLEGAYWKEGLGVQRRLATYAFPGIVLGYLLLETRWQAVAGLASAVGLPTQGTLGQAVVAVATLAATGVAAVIALTALQRGLRAHGEQDSARTRHMLALLAAFLAFNLYYAIVAPRFVGDDPTALRITFLAMATVSAPYYWRRLDRTERDYLRDRVVQRILAEEGIEPGDDPLELYYAKVLDQPDRQEALQRAYAIALEEALADGVVTPREKDMLEGLRHELGIDANVHAAAMSSAQTAGQETVVPLERSEKHLQITSYIQAVREMYHDGELNQEEERRLRQLRREYAISRTEHAAIVLAVQQQLAASETGLPETRQTQPY